jgi:hypothetical protein
MTAAIAWWRASISALVLRRCASASSKSSQAVEAYWELDCAVNNLNVQNGPVKLAEY